MEGDPLREYSGRSRFEKGLDVVSSSLDKPGLNVCRTPEFRSVQEHIWSWRRGGSGNEIQGVLRARGD